MVPVSFLSRLSYFTYYCIKQERCIKSILTGMTSELPFHKQKKKKNNNM